MSPTMALDGWAWWAGVVRVEIRELQNFKNTGQRRYRRHRRNHAIIAVPTPVDIRESTAAYKHAHPLHPEPHVHLVSMRDCGPAETVAILNHETLHITLELLDEELASEQIDDEDCWDDSLEWL